jgi:hypoxanthine phosphoribosyltransferase
MADKKYISYNAIHKLVKNLAVSEIDKFQPELMVAIGGGGFIPARILRTFVKIPILAVALKLYLLL